jgi:hypothetical protein
MNEVIIIITEPIKYFQNLFSECTPFYKHEGARKRNVINDNFGHGRRTPKI